MKKSFTLIELIFVIVIIGLLAAVAIPKFSQTKVSASLASAKSVVSSIRTAIETKHGEWIINDNLSDGYTSQGYPQKLDDAEVNKSDQSLFGGADGIVLLKNPIKSCSQNDCWMKYEENTSSNLSKYYYKFNNNKIILEYNGSNGKFICIDDGGISKEDCESIID